MDTPLDSAVQLEIRTLISNSLEEQDSALVPCFYAITGSYLYGTVTPSSDIDVRGFHCAPGKQYLLFEQPASQYSVSMELEEVDSEIDLTSYELREFGQMIAKSDFTTVELLYSDRFLINEVPAEIDGLEATIEEFLPAQLPYRYEGMVKSLHPEEAHIDTNSTTPLDLKPYIYSLRGALAAQYVVQNNTVEPKLTTLAAALLDRNEVAIVRSSFKIYRMMLCQQIRQSYSPKSMISRNENWRIYPRFRCRTIRVKNIETNLQPGCWKSGSQLKLGNWSGHFARRPKADLSTMMGPACRAHHV
jgi:predicted nucleotidyltransferase